LEISQEGLAYQRRGPEGFLLAVSKIQ